MIGFCLYALEDVEQERQFEELYRLYCDKMMRLALSILHHHHDAEEAVQDAFCALAQNWYSLRDRSDPALRNYLYKATRNAAIDRYRKQQRTEIPLPPEQIPEIAAQIDIPREYADNETYLTLLNILSSLPAVYRDVLSLYWYHDCKPRQIASLLGRPLETVKSQLKRGNALLRKAMKKGESL